MLSAPENREFSYNIRTDAIEIEFGEFLQTPSCDLILDYTITMTKLAELPYFFEIDLEAQRLVVYSDDINDEGTYDFTVTARTPVDYTYTP